MVSPGEMARQFMLLQAEKAFSQFVPRFKPVARLSTYQADRLDAAKDAVHNKQTAKNEEGILIDRDKRNRRTKDDKNVFMAKRVEFSRKHASEEIARFLISMVCTNGPKME